ncbi:DUF4760 domain-containing protein [Sphingoaurantiacus capsulatus]|uniref:DUF4760 domain-containing protein n=1 Tax=Sphingoaurantiacus capsulatus TaxID=1771310 RepID=A0ABV7XDP7_9SPHN
MLSAVAAFILIKSSKRTALRKATLDLILRAESDNDYLGARRAFREMINAGEDFGALGRQKAPDADKSGALRILLNFNELIAISIREGAIDVRVYRRWLNAAYIKDYDLLRSFITNLRNKEGNQRIYCEFAQMAEQWRNDPWPKPPGFFKRVMIQLGRID